MVSGLNQEIELLGRRFHFQSELVQRGNLSVRTEIFVDGKIVATRSSPLDDLPADAAGDLVRSRIREAHERVVDSVIQRAKNYQGEQTGEAPSGAPAPPGDATVAVHIAPRPTEPPPKEAWDALEETLRIRWMFGRLRLGLGLDDPDQTLDHRLRRAARAFGWLVGLPSFELVRVDEQIRCHLVKDRVEKWLSTGGENEDLGRKIWNEILELQEYVAEINRREQLSSLDRQLLGWAIGRLEGGGEMASEIHDELRKIFGLDVQLDRLIHEPAKIPDATWRKHLRRVLVATRGPD